MARIPKSSVFSVKTCSRARDMVASAAEEGLGLALALLIDMCAARASSCVLLSDLFFFLSFFSSSMGHASPWYGYLQALRVADIALFWGLDGKADGIEARQWLKGTEAEKELGPSWVSESGLTTGIKEASGFVLRGQGPSGIAGDGYCEHAGGLLSGLRNSIVPSVCGGCVLGAVAGTGGGHVSAVTFF